MTGKKDSFRTVTYFCDGDVHPALHFVGDFQCSLLGVDLRGNLPYAKRKFLARLIKAITARDPAL